MPAYSATASAVFVIGVLVGLFGPDGLRWISESKHRCAVAYPFRSERGFTWAQYTEAEARLKLILLGQDFSCFYAFLSFNSIPATRVNRIRQSTEHSETPSGRSAYNVIPKHWLENVSPIPSITNALIYFENGIIVEVVVPDSKNIRHPRLKPSNTKPADVRSD